MENSEICPVITARGKYFKVFKTQTQVGGHQHLSGSMNKIKQTDPHAGNGEMFLYADGGTACRSRRSSTEFDSTP